MINFIIHSNKTCWGNKWHIITSNGMGHIACEIEDEDPDTFYISALSVYESSRNKGIGKALVNEAEKLAISLNIKRFRLNIEKNMSSLLEYYGNLGYEIWDEDDTYYYMVKYNKYE